MTTFHSIEELRDLLVEHADDFQAPVGLGPRAAAAGGRVRRRRYAVAAVAVTVVLASIIFHIQQPEEPTPARPSPTPTRVAIGGQVVWSAALPGLDLPVGEPLTVPYGVGNSVFVDGQEHVLPGGASAPYTGGTQHLVQIADTPLGVLTVTERGIAPFFNVRLVSGQQVRDIGDAVSLGGLVALGSGADGKIHIAFVDNEPDVHDVYEGVLLDPQLLAVPVAARQAVGYLNGDPLFSLSDPPGSLEQFHREPGGAEVSIERFTSDAPVGAQLTFAGWRTIGADSFAIYTDVQNGCTYAYHAPGSGAQAWTACDDQSRQVMLVGPQYGAVGTNVYDLASGELAARLDLAQAGRFEVAAIGWETPTRVILRVASYEPYVGGGESPAATVPPRYVAIRCAVDTGTCARLPHPVDVMAAAQWGALPPN